MNKKTRAQTQKKNKQTTIPVKSEVQTFDLENVQKNRMMTC